MLAINHDINYSEKYRKPSETWSSYHGNKATGLRIRKTQQGRRAKILSEIKKNLGSTKIYKYTNILTCSSWWCNTNIQIFSQTHVNHG